MATREEMIKFLEFKRAEATQEKPANQKPSREEMIAFLQNKIKQDAEPTFGDKALGVVGKVASALDSVTGAPSRSAIGALQDGQNPLTAFKNQFAEDPSAAPTGAEIAKKAGVSDEAFAQFTGDDVAKLANTISKIGGAPALALKILADNAPQSLKDQTYKPTPADVAGLGIDIAADPTMLIPGRAIGKTAEVVGDAAKFLKSKTGRAIGKTAELVGDAAKATTVKAGSTLTGVSEKSIKTYIEQRKAIDEIIAKHGGDMTLAADELRENLQSAIQNKVRSLNGNIEKAIKEAPSDVKISSDSIIDSLTETRNQLNPALFGDKIEEINEVIKKIEALPKQLDAKSASDAKRFLQGMAEGAYLKNGQVFTSSKEAARAAKAGGREARKIEMELAPGTIEPNKELSRLHRYESNVNKNLIAPGKTESALLAAGSGANARNVKNLRDISNITGFDALGEAEKLSSAKTFGEASFTPVDTTGKSAARMGLAAGAGSLIGGPMGAAISVAFTSPAVLKKAIQAGDVSADLVKKIAKSTGEITDVTIKRAVEFSKSKEGQRLLKSGAAAKQAVIDSPKKSFPRAADEGEMTAQKEPKGYDKFSAEGAERIQKHDSSLSKEVIEQIKGTPKGKELLAQASMLSPGSKAMESILKQIQSAYLQGGK